MLAETCVLIDHCHWIPFSHPCHACSLEYVIPTVSRNNSHPSCEATHRSKTPRAIPSVFAVPLDSLDTNFTESPRQYARQNIGSKALRCAYCYQALPAANRLVHHIRTKHSTAKLANTKSSNGKNRTVPINQKAHACQDCGEVFILPTSLACCNEENFPTMTVMSQDRRMETLEDLLVCPG